MTASASGACRTGDSSVRSKSSVSPDGTLLASGGVGPETTVRLWDVATGKKRGRLAGHAGGVTSLAFSPDGERLVSGSEDSTALVWDVAEALPVGR